MYFVTFSRGLWQMLLSHVMAEEPSKLEFSGKPASVSFHDSSEKALFTKRMCC